ncbi:MAG: hypothetical protein Q8L52_00565 [bacterium]|nr:hypothetical protein [bacterium]
MIALLIAGTLAVLSGCVARPMVVRQVPVYQPAPPSQPIAVEDDGAPPAEYVIVSEVVYYDIEPGVAFWPVFFGYPGSCYCYMPARFVGGVWWGPGRHEIHRGHFAQHRGEAHHLNAWRQNGGTFRGHTAVRGHIERGRAVPPAGHAKPTPHVAPPRHTPPPGVHRPPAPPPAVHRPPPAVHTPPPAVHRPSTVHRPPPAVHTPPPAVHRPPPAHRPAPPAPRKCGEHGQPKC